KAGWRQQNESEVAQVTHRAPRTGTSATLDSLMWRFELRLLWRRPDARARLCCPPLQRWTPPIRTGNQTMSIPERAICLSAAALLLASAVPAQQRFTPDMTRRVVRLSSAAEAPDGRTVASVVTRPNFTDDPMDSEPPAADLASG